jgi:hypothetical protein
LLEQSFSSIAGAKFFLSCKSKFFGTAGAKIFLNCRSKVFLELQEEARDIFRWAEEEGLTGTNYVWIVTQSVIGTAFFNDIFFIYFLCGQCRQFLLLELFL